MTDMGRRNLVNSRSISCSFRLPFRSSISISTRCPLHRSRHTSAHRGGFALLLNRKKGIRSSITQHMPEGTHIEIKHHRRRVLRAISLHRRHMQDINSGTSPESRGSGSDAMVNIAWIVSIGRVSQRFGTLISFTNCDRQLDMSDECESLSA